MTTTALITSPGRTPVRRSAGTKKTHTTQPLVWFLVLLVIGVTVAPIVYVILGGFRTTGQLAENPTSLPNPWVFTNYASILTSSTFWQQVANSAVVSIVTTLGVVVLGVMTAFIIARYTFRGRNAMYTLFTAGLLFPLSVAILPLYLMLQNLGLLGSLAGVIIPQIAFALPTTIIILVPFLRAIPTELEDAASIDGTSRIGFFWRILLPLSGPGLVTVGVLAFVGSWNGFLLPLLVLNDPGSFTLPLGVQAFSSEHSQDTAMVLAFTSLSMLPALAFFTLAERRIVGGLSGAVKG